MLSAEKFAKMAARLRRPAGERVGTDNHVERTNRRLWHFEKVRYKWRRRRTIVRFVILAIQLWRQSRIAEESRDGGRDAKPTTPEPNTQVT